MESNIHNIYGILYTRNRRLISNALHKVGGIHNLIPVQRGKSAQNALGGGGGGGGGM
jgi:hypothetical protein